MTEPSYKKLLKILADGKCHSGEAIAAKLKVTRAAVWKLIQQLKNWHINIEAKPNQGYCIPGGMELLDKKKILQWLPQVNPNEIIIFDELPSTNPYLMDRVREKKKNIRYCLAEHQTQGRGRFGRPWVSAFGKNIYLSCLWTFPGDLSQLAGLSLVVAVALLRTFKKYGVSEGLSLKWPNDIQWHGKKIAGILIELHGESHHVSDVVIGIGVNGELSSELRKLAKKEITDVAEMMSEPLERNRFAGLLIAELENTLELFQKKGLSAFLNDWQAYDTAINKPVKLILGEKIIEGIYRGINPQNAELILEDKQGRRRHYSAGEVSLRIL